MSHLILLFSWHLTYSNGFLTGLMSGYVQALLSVSITCKISSFYLEAILPQKSLVMLERGRVEFTVNHHLLWFSSIC